MISVKDEIMRRLAVLVGLDVSGIGHAADMLTLQFGPLRQVTSQRGTQKRLGSWALHVQCNWRCELAGEIFANEADFRRSDDEVNRVTDRLNALLVVPVPAVVESVSASVSGGASITLSHGLIIVIEPAGVAAEEDWRLFAPGTDEDHFVIEGGRIDP